jgi:tetratricopeptide (TPR) repeat protein
MSGQSTLNSENMLRLAGAALDQRRPDEAERITRDLLAKNPHHVGALHLLGLACLAQARAQDAVIALEQVAAARSDSMVETQLAIALRQSGRTSEALACLQRAVERQPPFPFAFHELGVLLFSQRRLDEAEAAVRRGLQVAPTMPELSVILGGICLDRADRTNAKAAFARALASAPQHPGALYGLGAALLDEGDFARAAERFRQALTSDPNYPQAQIGLGTCMLELGLREEASRVLRAAAKTAPRFYDKALRALANSAHGQFWLRPSKAAEFFKSDK